MKLLHYSLLAVTCLVFTSCSQQSADNRIVLKGAGSSFAAPLLRKWSQEYEKADRAAIVKYVSVGSGEGQVRFLNGTTDFGVSEAVLSADQLATAGGEVVTIPIAAGSIALTYNPHEIADGLKLSREVYAAIFLGRIRSWNDPQIVALNPGVSLPNRAIRPVVRLDSSGTTNAFTSHLSAISETWRGGPGSGKLVSWPNEFEKESGNERVAGTIRQAIGAIGYVEFGTARAAGLHMASLENNRGEYITPSIESAELAIANIGYRPDELAALRDPEAAGAYPIVTCTFLLTHKQNDDRPKVEAIQRFLQWSVTEGQKFGEALGYAPITSEIAAGSLRTIDQMGR